MHANIYFIFSDIRVLICAAFVSVCISDNTLKNR